METWGPDLTCVCLLRPCLSSPGLRAFSSILRLAHSFIERGRPRCSFPHGPLRQSKALLAKSISLSLCSQPYSRLTAQMTYPPLLNVFRGDPASSSPQSSSLSGPLVPPPTVLASLAGPVSESELLATTLGENTHHERAGSSPSLQRPTPTPGALGHLSLLHPHVFTPALSVPILLTQYLCLNSPSSFCLRAFALADCTDSFSSFLSQLKCHPLGRRNRREKVVHVSLAFSLAI